MNRQRGFMIWVYLAVAAFLAAAGVAIVTTYNHAITRATTAEQDAKEWKEAHALEVENSNRLYGDLNAQKKLVTSRTTERNQAASQLATALSKLDQLAASNPVAAANLRTPVDPDVRSLRRLNAGCSASLAVQCTPGRPSGDGAAAAEGRDDQRPDSGERNGEKSPS